MFFVFDCTAHEGYAFSTPFRWLARLGSRLLTAWTGRTYDYEAMNGRKD